MNRPPPPVRFCWLILPVALLAACRSDGLSPQPRHLDLFGRLTLSGGVAASGIQMLFLRSTSVLANNGGIQTAACTKEAGHTINGTDPCP
jgi:hypothetical protein